MFIEPKKGIKKEDCWFYHKIKLEDGNLIDAKWDLRGCIDAYLSNFDFKGKRVIDVGAASGYLSFEMEKNGADVVSFDMPNGSYWDHLINRGYTPPKPERTNGLFNSYEYLHEKLKSNNKIFRANIYDRLPDEIGEFDVAVFGTMLSHVRDPILALMNILYKVKDYAILINPFQDNPSFYRNVNGSTWWMIGQKDIEQIMLDIGFKLQQVTNTNPQYLGDEKPYKSILFKRC